MGYLAPLRSAAWNGVVEVFLGTSDVNPNELSGHGKHPLWHAANAGHERVVEILVGRAASIPANQITLTKHHSGGVVGASQRLDHFPQV